MRNTGPQKASIVCPEKWLDCILFYSPLRELRNATDSFHSRIFRSGTSANSNGMMFQFLVDLSLSGLLISTQYLVIGFTI